MNRGIAKIVDAMTILAGGAFLALAFLTVVEVLMRKGFNTSLMGVDEIGGYVYAIGSAVGFIAALTANSHVRVDLVLSRLSALPRLILHVFSYLTLGAFAALLTWRAGAQVLRSWELGAVAPTPLRTPLVIPQGIWAGLLAVFTLLILSKLVVAIRLIFASPRGIDKAAEHLDISPVSEEARAELAALRARSTQGSAK